MGDTATAEVAGITVRDSHARFGLLQASLWSGTGESGHERRRLRIYDVAASGG